MNEMIAQEPLWLQAWIGWLVIINSASILFAFTRREAHWVLTAWLANLLFMPMLFETFGYVRLLGLSHIVFWTPLLIYLWMRRHDISMATWSGRYLWVLFATNLVSLLIDYVDVVRYFAGDGDLA